MLLSSFFIFETAFAQKKSSYAQFVKCNKLFIDYMQYTDDTLLLKAKERITNLKIISQYYDYSKIANTRLFEIYVKLKMKDSAFFYAKKSLKEGTDITQIDIENKIFSEKETLKLKKIQKNNIKNTSTQKIDTALKTVLEQMRNDDQRFRVGMVEDAKMEKNAREELHKKQKRLDSINRIKLYNIVKKYGWVGKDVLGEDFRSPMSLISVHLKQEDNLYFLEKAMKSAEQGKVTWFDAQTMMSMCFFRYEKEDGFNKLRKIYLTKNNFLDIEKSYFQLHNLIKFYTNNKKSNIHFFVAYYQETEKKYFSERQKALEEVKKFLVENGIAEDRIEILAEPRKVKDDKLGKFIFGFTTSKIKK